MSFGWMFAVLFVLGEFRQMLKKRSLSGPKHKARTTVTGSEPHKTLLAQLGGRRVHPCHYMPAQSGSIFLWSGSISLLTMSIVCDKLFRHSAGISSAPSNSTVISRPRTAMPIVMRSPS